MAKKSAPLHVLVVDDEPLIRWSLGETLTEQGHVVVEAGDAAGALRALHENPAFDVVLLDYRLPDSDDLTLLATIRRFVPTPAVIMMTAFGTPEATEGALRLGACRIVPKPFEVHDMVDWVVQASTSSSGS